MFDWIMRVDTREDYWNEALQQALELTGVPHQRVTLRYGDYSIWNIVTERKDVGDFIESDIAGNLYDQCFRLVELCAENEEIPHLHIHGNLDEYIDNRKEVTRNTITKQDFWSAYWRVKHSFPDLSVSYVQFKTDPMKSELQNRTDYYYEMLECQLAMGREARYSNKPYIKVPKKYRKERDPNKLILRRALYLTEKQADVLINTFGPLGSIIYAAQIGEMNHKVLPGIGPETVAKIKLMADPKGLFTPYGYYSTESNK